MRAQFAPPKGTKREKINAYSSPFIAKAQAKALERAREAKKQLPRKGFIKNAWDDTPRLPGGVFDPELKKTEIFKIEPRRSAAAVAEDNLLDQSQLSAASRPTIRQRFTMRTHDVVPSRRPAQVSSAHGESVHQVRASTPPSSSSARPRSTESPPPPPPPPLPAPQSSRPSSSTQPQQQRLRRSQSPPRSRSPAPRSATPPSRPHPLDPAEQAYRDQRSREYKARLEEKIYTMLNQHVQRQQGAVLQRRRVVRRAAPIDQQAANMSEVMKYVAQAMKSMSDVVNMANDRRPRRRDIFSNSRRARQGSHHSADMDHQQPQAQAQQPLPPQPPAPHSPYACIQQALSSPARRAAPVPQTKASVLDMAMAKLQAIEQSEREICAYLAVQQSRPITMPPPPVKALKGRGLTAEAVQQVTGSPPTAQTRPTAIAFPRLTPPGDRHDSTYRYMQELAEARRTRDLQFGHGSLAQTVSTLSDVLYEQILGEVVADLDKDLEDCSRAVLKTI